MKRIYFFFLVPSFSPPCFPHPLNFFPHSSSSTSYFLSFSHPFSSFSSSSHVNKYSCGTTIFLFFLTPSFPHPCFLHRLFSLVFFLFLLLLMLYRAPPLLSPPLQPSIRFPTFRTNASTLTSLLLSSLPFFLPAPSSLPLTTSPYFPLSLLPIHHSSHLLPLLPPQQSGSQAHSFVKAFPVVV